MATTLRKFQVFRNDGTPFVGSISDIKAAVATMISNNGLTLSDGELINIRYKDSQQSTEIKSLLGTAYVSNNQLTIAWTDAGNTVGGVEIVGGDESYATVQLGVTEDPAGTFTLTSVINPSALNFKSTTANGVKTYTLQVKNNTQNAWVDTSATFTVDEEKFVDSMEIVTGTWNTSVTPHVFTPSATGADLAIELDYSIGGASTTVYVEIPDSVYMEAITGGDLWVSQGTPSTTTAGNTYIRLQNEAGEYVYVDVTSLVNTITSITGEASLNGSSSYVAVHASTPASGVVALTSELLHSTVTVNTNDSLSATNGVLTSNNISVIENYIDNYDCGTFTLNN